MASRLKLKTLTSVGFTLIEVMIVLAISSLLVLILINNYSQSRRRAEFHDAIERIVVKLEQVRGEANSTTNSNAGGGENPSRVNFSKVVNFRNTTGNVGQMRIFNLSADNTSDPPQNVVLDADAAGNPGSPQIIDIPWGVQFIPPLPLALPSVVQASPSSYTRSDYNYIVFARALANGKINTFVYRLGPAEGGEQGLTNSGIVSFTVGSANDTDVAHLQFVSEDGKQTATVNINGKTGEITSTYND